MKAHIKGLPFCSSFTLSRCKAICALSRKEEISLKDWGLVVCLSDLFSLISLSMIVTEMIMIYAHLYIIDISICTSKGFYTIENDVDWY